MTMSIDEAFMKMGMLGRWQIRYYCVLCFGCLLPAAWHIVSIVWIGYKPLHHCTLPTNTSQLDDWIPHDKHNILNSCSIYNNITNDESTTTCQDGWTYDLSISGPTIVNKFDLVCDRAYLVDTVQSVMTFGVLVGSLIFTKLSDTFGRKPILVLSQLSMCCIGALTVLPSKLSVYYVLKFFEGTFQQGVILCNLVMLCEMFSSKDRAFICIFGSAVWGLGNSLLPLIAYLVRDWVVFELVISLYGFLFIPLFWSLPETVPWLYANNKYEEVSTGAERTLERALKMNKLNLPSPILHSIHPPKQPPVQNGDSMVQDESCMTQSASLGNGVIDDVVETKVGGQWWKGRWMSGKSDCNSVQYSILDLFKNRILLKHMVICLLFGLVDNLVYYGLVLSSNSLSGNHYINGFLNAIIEVPACLLTYVVVNKWGRRRPIAVTHVLSGLSLLACLFVSHSIDDMNTRTIIINVMTNIGKFGITSAFAIVFFYVAELFPTNLRNQAVGICVFFARLGSIMASYSTFVLERYPTLLFSVFGTLSIFVAIFVFFLPETHNRALPESINDMKKWYQDGKELKEEEKDLNDSLNDNSNYLIKPDESFNDAQDLDIKVRRRP